MKNVDLKMNYPEKCSVIVVILSLMSTDILPTILYIHICYCFGDNSGNDYVYLHTLQMYSMISFGNSFATVTFIQT